ncbi:hypothetical protein Pcinc_013543 [Petrolisthes cinctipes]|uniref:Uncharacterized protein n=1 Tax=Petrolisthes cinctipes TaxID=88211 RepID=A0AAE1FX86_PETCI|nr:hypothetical protein Pcinc_013543 [Petrolisthes cinctipes]
MRKEVVMQVRGICSLRVTEVQEGEVRAPPSCPYVLPPPPLQAYLLAHLLPTTALNWCVEYRVAFAGNPTALARPIPSVARWPRALPDPHHALPTYLPSPHPSRHIPYLPSPPFPVPLP